jgi:hypothetical protein
MKWTAHKTRLHFHLHHHHHSYFGELTALASAENLSETECEALREHLVVCKECRKSERAFRDLVTCLWLPRSDSNDFENRMKALPDEAFRGRFLERATRDGIQFSPRVTSGKGLVG